MSFSLGKQPLHLTRNEFRLFYHLYCHLGELCLHKDCAEVVWEREYDAASDIDGLQRLVNRIRKKLKDIDPEAKNVLVTHHGMGYMLDL